MYVMYLWRLSPTYIYCGILWAQQRQNQDVDIPFSEEELTCGSDYESVVNAGGSLEKWSAHFWEKLMQGPGKLSKS